MAKAGHGQSTQPSRMRAGRGGNKGNDPSGNSSQSHSDDHGTKSKRRHKQWPYWAFVVGLGECFKNFFRCRLELGKPRAVGLTPSRPPYARGSGCNYY